MSIYPPPNYTQPLNIFNPANYGDDGIAITKSYLDANYLKYPVAQAGTETLNTAIVNGTLTANSNVVVNSSAAAGSSDIVSIRNDTGNMKIVLNPRASVNAYNPLTQAGDVVIGGSEITTNPTGGTILTTASSVTSGIRIGKNSMTMGVGGTGTTPTINTTYSGTTITNNAGIITQNGAVIINSNNNLTMNAGTGRINQPSVTGDVSTRNSFKLSDFVFNSNISTGTNNAFEFYDNVNGRGLFLVPNCSTGALSDTNISNDCVLSSRSIQNTNAITISNWNTDMRNGLRVFTTDISNCGVRLQCGPNTGATYTELAMNYNRGTNTTTTSFNNAINFNPTLPIATNSSKRLLSGLGTLSFTDISGNNSTNGSVVSRIWTDSSLVGGLNGMYYDCGINNGFHQFSARDALGNVSTPIYYGASLTSVSNTFVVRNPTITSNRFDIVGDTSQNTFIRGRSSTASTDAHIHFNCDSVNAGGTTTNNAVLNFTPTFINIRRPIQFNYLTTPSAFNQLGYSQGYDIPTTSFASSASIRNSASFSFTSAGTYLINWKPYAQMASGTAIFTTFRFGVANTGGTTFDADTQTYTSYMDLKVAYPTLTVNDNLNEPTSCVYTATTSSIAYFNFLANYTGGTNINIGGYYTITRIG